MTAPEDALQQARQAAARMRSAGAYEDAVAMPIAPTDEIPRSKLLAWAVLEPDVSEIGSTRRIGVLVTGVKRLLLRLLAQYHVALTADQSRFNVTLLRYVDALEARVAELEDQLREAPPAPEARPR